MRSWEGNTVLFFLADDLDAVFLLKNARGYDATTSKQEKISTYFWCQLTNPKVWYFSHTLKWTSFLQMKNTTKAKVPLVWIWNCHILDLHGVTFISTCVVSAIVRNFQLKLSASLSLIPNMSKHKYVVVDWGSWGIDVQSSSKIIVSDPFNVSEGKDCSIQGTDPVTKRPMLFDGHILAVFGELNNEPWMFSSGFLHRFNVVQCNLPLQLLACYKWSFTLANLKNCNGSMSCVWSCSTLKYTVILLLIIY